MIMADVNGLGLMVEGCGSGLSVPCEDPSLLAAAMSEMIHADSATTSQWGSSGKDASREYQWDRVTDRVLEVYRRVVGE